MGKRVHHKKDQFDKYKIAIMRSILYLKFAIPEMRALLLATGDAELIEGNTHGDTFWGCVKTPNGVWYGENWLGRLLMEIRTEIRLGVQDHG